MHACGKFGGHERSVRVARGAAESKSSFFFLAGSVEGSAIPFRSRYDRFYPYIGVNFTFESQDCDRYIWDIVIPRVVKPRFCSIHYTVTLAGLKISIVTSGISLYRRSLYISGFHCTWFQTSC